MGTRSVVAELQGDTWRGRYVHWDGYPAGVGVALLKIRYRMFPHDLPAMVHALTVAHAGWSTVDADEVQKPEAGGRFAAVPGIGIGYTSAQIDADEWITAESDGMGTEWCYVMGSNGIYVMEAVRHGGHATGAFGFNEGATWLGREHVPWAVDDLDLDVLTEQMAGIKRS